MNLDDLKTVPSGHIRYITERNEVSLVKQEPRMAEIRTRLGADGIDTVNLHNGCVMLLDDTGHDQRPANEIATLMYHSVCRPGTTHQICGPVAIVRDSDFA